MDPLLKVLFTDLIADSSSCNHEDSADNMLDRTARRQSDTNMTVKIFSVTDHF